MIVSGFCKEVSRQLPMEFAVEARKLLGVSLEKRGMERGMMPCSESSISTPPQPAATFSAASTSRSTPERCTPSWVLTDPARHAGASSLAIRNTRSRLEGPL